MPTLLFHRIHKGLRCLIAASGVWLGLHGLALAQNDFRPQWQDARPPAATREAPARVYPEAPKILPVLPQPARMPGMADTHTGLALQGFDPVAYFTDQKPVTGRAEFEAVIHGETWRFAQAANLKIFSDKPEIFRPQFGGFDAESIANGYVVEADPQNFLVIDSALYLFRTMEGRMAFAADAGLRAKAQAQWSKLKNDTFR
ncbi:MAG: YHS domain-containing (seleno)protein [Beijerinckiaceae bacterium]